MNTTTTEKKRGLRIFAVLSGNHSLRVFWFGDLVSVFGNVLTTVALPFYTLQLTGSPGLMGAAIAIQWLPGLFIRLVAGVIIDRVDRRKLLMWVSFLQAIPLLVIVTVDNLAVLYAVIFIAGMLQQIVFPALYSVLPQIVRPDDLLPANALFSSSRTLSQIVGASLAGAVVAFLGAKPAFALDAASFVVFGLLLTTLPPLPPKDTPPERDILGDLRMGLAFVWRHPAVRAVCGLAFIGMLTVMGSSLALVVMCTREWGVGALGFGILSTVAALGSLAASVAVGSWGERFSQYRLVFSSFLVQGLALLTLGLIPLYVAALPLRFISAAAMPAWNVPLDAYLQKSIPHDMMGRVYSLTGVSVSLGMVLGSLISGPITERVGGGNLIGMMGLVAVIGLILLMRSLRPIAVKVVTHGAETRSAAGG